MARRVSLLLSFLLAFLVIVNVEAKSKADQIRAYQFTSDYCVGDPKGANVDLQRDHCVNVDARSVKPVVDAKRLKWLSDVNNGAHSCYLMSFDSPDCPDTQNVGVTVMELPPAFNKCVTSSQPIRSVKFVCGLKMSVSASALTSTTTTTMVATSWSVGKDDLLTPSERTMTVTMTTTTATTQTVPASILSASTTSQTSAAFTTRRLEARQAAADNAMTKNVWLYHPWSRSALCYYCYRKKAGDFGNFKCKGGPNVKAQCSQRPIPVEGEPITTTTTSTISDSTTVAMTTTTISVVTDGTLTHTSTSTTTQPVLEARKSWHKSVYFENPWAPGNQMCADAEWEKRGKPNTEIRLQKIKYRDGDDCEDAQPIDLPDPIIESTQTSTTSTATTSSTSTTTVTGWTEHSTTTTTETMESTTATTQSPSPVAIGDVTDEEFFIPDVDSANAVPLHGDL